MAGQRRHYRLLAAGDCLDCREPTRISVVAATTDKVMLSVGPMPPPPPREPRPRQLRLFEPAEPADQDRISPIPARFAGWPKRRRTP